MGQKAFKTSARRSYLKSEMMALGDEAGQYGASGSGASNSARPENELHCVEERMREIIMSYDDSEDVVGKDGCIIEI